MSLDQWGVITPTGELKKPLILSDAHANYLYEQSYDRQVEKHYDWLIDCKLAEEELEKEIEMKQHAKYVESNYVRVGDFDGKN
jgi:hypothetical protein